VTTLAGASGVSGYEDGIGTNAQFSLAFGIALDGPGDFALVVSVSARACTVLSACHQKLIYLHASDQLQAGGGSSTIRKIVVSSQRVTSIAGQAGVIGFADGIGTNAIFDFPSGVAMNSEGTYAIIVSP
jgi:hypothetical protein